MNTDILIPITVTLVTGMAVGAIYLMYWLLTDGKPESSVNDEESGLSSADAEPAPATEQSSAADTHH